MKTLLFLSSVLLFTFTLSADEPIVQPTVDPIVDPDTQLPVASIEIADAAGKLIINSAETGQLLIISSTKAIHANVEGSLTWIVEPKYQTFSTDGGKTLVLNTGLQPSQLSIMQIVSTKSGKNTYQKISIKIGSGPNPPPLPIPDDDTPIETSLLKVLIVEETGKRPTLPEDQQDILFSVAIRAYAESKCTKTDGNTDFLILDVNLDVTLMPEWAKTAMKEPMSSLPFILISNGSTGFAGPLPADEGSTLTLLKKYGG